VCSVSELQCVCNSYSAKVNCSYELCLVNLITSPNPIYERVSTISGTGAAICTAVVVTQCNGT
jgi:hypothetical protein